MADVWHAGTEFMVSQDTEWVPCCAECLPILLRRALRRRQAPIVRWYFGPEPDGCKVRQPHPAPGEQIPHDGYSCPRPLTGDCETAQCDHD